MVGLLVASVAVLVLPVLLLLLVLVALSGCSLLPSWGTGKQWQKTHK
jgi:hypothetical protein